MMAGPGACTACVPTGRTAQIAVHGCRRPRHCLLLPRRDPCRRAGSNVAGGTGVALRSRAGRSPTRGMRSAAAPVRSSVRCGTKEPVATCGPSRTDRRWAAATTARPLKRPRPSAPAQARASAPRTSSRRTAREAPAAVMTGTSSGHQQSRCRLRRSQRRQRQRLHLRSHSRLGHRQRRPKPPTCLRRSLATGGTED